MFKECARGKGKGMNTDSSDEDLIDELRHHSVDVEIKRSREGSRLRHADGEEKRGKC